MKGAREKEVDSDFLQQLLKSDPSKLIMAATNARAFSELTNFSEKLRNSIESAKKTRLDKEVTAQKAIAKETQAKVEREKNRLIAGNLCFVCKKSVEMLSPCAGFKEHGVPGEGVMLCEECEEETTTGKCCLECNHMLCDNDDCCDPTYKCSSCEKNSCAPCAELDARVHTWCEFCDNKWYCLSCYRDTSVEEQCCSCAETTTTCGNCSSSNQLQKCDGDCHMPLCDDCVSSLACDKEVRLCGDCNFDCDDCDFCAGYYGSRWK